MNKIGIIGAGAWGTALALVAARAGNEVTLLSRTDEQAHTMRSQRMHPTALPGVIFDAPLTITANPQALRHLDFLVLAVPAQVTRQVTQNLSPYFAPFVPLILTAKGIEHNTGLLMSEVIGEILPRHPLAVLSGPTFALEVARRLPTAVTLATKAQQLAPPLMSSFATKEFRPYLSTDVMGVQVGGAVKNVLAIAAGIVEGRGLGDNARAALISRGMSEIVRLGIAKGGNMETFLGLSGCGDLVLTCTSSQSRNMSYGRLLGLGKEQHLGPLKEGVFTAQSVVKLARKLKVTMPICDAIYRIVTHQSSIDEEIQNLLERPLHPTKTGELFLKGTA